MAGADVGSRLGVDRLPDNDDPVIGLGVLDRNQTVEHVAEHGFRITLFGITISAAAGAFRSDAVPGLHLMIGNLRHEVGFDSCRLQQPERGRMAVPAAQKPPGPVLVAVNLDGEAGDSLTFDQVLMMGGDKGVTVGAPLIDGATVTGELVETNRGKKIIVFKMRRRKNYRRKYGHRQPFTELRIQSVQG